MRGSRNPHSPLIYIPTDTTSFISHIGANLQKKFSPSFIMQWTGLLRAAISRGAKSYYAKLAKLIRLWCKNCMRCRKSAGR